jgi:hypothetical protein
VSIRKGMPQTMNAGQLAALIAAGFFAAGMCAAVYVLIKLARLVSAATAVVTGYQAGADDLMARASAAVQRADEQLARTGALTESVEQVSASMSDLSEQVSAVAGTARLIANGLGVPALRLAAAGYGVRQALAVRLPGAAARQRRAVRLGTAGAGVAGVAALAPKGEATALARSADADGPRRAVRGRAAR